MSVTVTKNPLTGDILRATKNPEIFQVRVEETRVSYEGGFRRTSLRSALINGPEEELRAEFFTGQRINDQILIIESFTPFRTINPEKDLKIAGKTGIVCTLDDQPIFRNTVYTSNVDTTDTLIQHNNTDQIKTAQQEEVTFVTSDDLIMS